MTRLVAWALFVGVIYAGAKLVNHTGNPWNPAQFKPDTPSAAALHIPGCADKPGCAQ